MEAWPSLRCHNRGGQKGWGQIHTLVPLHSITACLQTSRNKIWSGRKGNQQETWDTLWILFWLVILQFPALERIGGLVSSSIMQNFCSEMPRMHFPGPTCRALEHAVSSETFWRTVEDDNKPLEGFCLLTTDVNKAKYTQTRFLLSENLLPPEEIPKTNQYKCSVYG